MADEKFVSEINIKVMLDQEKTPEKILWNASDNPSGTEDMECKAMLVSFFDSNHLDTYKIDLWTKEMQVIEMDRFMFQTLKSLSDTYFKATKNHNLANDMAKFVTYFGEQTEILKKEGEE